MHLLEVTFPVLSPMSLAGFIFEFPFPSFPHTHTHTHTNTSAVTTSSQVAHTRPQSGSDVRVSSFITPSFHHPFITPSFHHPFITPSFHHPFITPSFHHPYPTWSGDTLFSYTTTYYSTDARERCRPVIVTHRHSCPTPPDIIALILESGLSLRLSRTHILVAYTTTHHSTDSRERSQSEVVTHIHTVVLHHLTLQHYSEAVLHHLTLQH
ncbi:hypothetical protein RRG08_039742 [Elysia crispata]|uniref:Uncharacterized protein n=1 Tax=Elysia crispata TaxID=231223 RepID=A0AAE0YB61_9GAST|nr:hypothetical protein RRG08_039742 [Elysia crispata]